MIVYTVLVPHELVEDLRTKHTQEMHETVTKHEEGDIHCIA
jgi:hypothetical protein